MNDTKNIETILRHAPQAKAPIDLADQLKQQIQLPPPPEKISLWEFIQKYWIRAAGLAGSCALALLVLQLSSVGTVRTLGQSLDSLRHLKSFRVIERVRSGPGKPVIKDKTKRPMDWPNYLTSIHPENPFAETQRWYAQDPQSPGQDKIYTLSPREEIWQSGKLILTVDRATEVRKFRVNPNPTLFAQVAKAVVGNQEGAFREIHNAPGLSAKDANSIWVGETRGTFNDAEHITRIWINRSNNLPLRIQFWGTEWPEIAPEVLLQEYEFTDFDVDFPATTFAFEVTDAELVALSISRKELDTLPPNAFSIHLSGEDAGNIVGTVTDDKGVRQIKGNLPFAFIHTPTGKSQFDLRLEDGKKHSIIIEINGTIMNTFARGFEGKINADGRCAELSGIN